MDINLLFQIVAQQAAPQQANFMQSLVGMAPAFLLMFIIFHLMVIRPQQKKLKEQQDLINGLKKSDQVVTSGGLVGRVVSVENGFVTLEVSPNVRLRFEAQHIVKRFEQQVVQAKAA